MQRVTPEVKWAQRSSNSDASKNLLYLTLIAPNVVNPEIILTEKKLKFQGPTKNGSQLYHIELEFYEDVDSENFEKNHTDRNICLIIRKKELGNAFWPRLIKEVGKCSYIRTDFDKWVDEDEQNAYGNGDYSSQFGGMNDFDFSKFSGDMGEFDNMSKLDGTDSDDHSDTDDLKDESNEEMVTVDKE
ncbi:hypothetical protein PCANB_002676 [Pneumocystis canis]|nr:hypothetical protein PCK1_002766 [Pneumocystis canis]KAG5438571.1 hypothetical protein PCANB_002676 [Pneumocystis canis]